MSSLSGGHYCGSVTDNDASCVLYPLIETECQHLSINKQVHRIKQFYKQTIHRETLVNSLKSFKNLGEDSKRSKFDFCGEET